MAVVPLAFTEISARLRELRAEAGDPSYAEIARRIANGAGSGARGAPVSRATVYDCFRDGRKRFDVDLVMAIVRALADDEIAETWSSTLAALGRHKAAAAVVSVSGTLPHIELPFIGRLRERVALAHYPAVHWITALPGAGKTMIALEVAREAVASGEFDGVVFVDLRGHSPAGPPVESGAVVRAALRLLGEKSGALSPGAAVRKLRELLRSEKKLLVLDDAASSDQIREIIPDHGGISALVTSRVAPQEEGYRVLDLPMFASYESLALLDAVIGRSVVERDPEAAGQLLELTGNLPLAVSLTASRVAAKRDWSLGEHLELALLRRASLRLDEPVSQALELSYRALPASARTLLRVLADHPVGLLDRLSVDAIASGLISDIEAAVTALREHGLIAWQDSGQMRMHELVRVFAADHGVEEDSSSQRRAAKERLLRTTIDRVWSAYQVRLRARREVPREPRRAVTEVPMTPEDAASFLAASVDLLLYVALDPSLDDIEIWTEEEGAPGRINAIAETLRETLYDLGRTNDAVALFSEAALTARARGDRQGELRARLDLGVVFVLAGRAREVDSVLAELDTSAPGWAAEAPTAYNVQGLSLIHRGHLDESRVVLARGLDAAAEVGDLWREGLLWNQIGLAYLRSGDMGGCRDALERSISIGQQCNDLVSAARGRVNLAQLLYEMNDLEPAENTALQALADMRSLGHVPGLATAYSVLCAVVCDRGRFDEGADLAEQGIAIARDGGIRHTEVELLRTLGRCHLGSGRHDHARAEFERALGMAEELGSGIDIAGCYEEIGDCAHEAGNDADAERFWARARQSYLAVESPLADVVQAKLENTAGS